MTKSDKLQQELAEVLAAIEEKKKYNKIESFFPDEGEYRRELYVKHVQFLNAGEKHRQRAFIASNRSGKTVAGAYEMTCHLTGRYPHWWQGRRFDHPIKAWAASISNQVTKEVLEAELLGDPNDIGSGMIPKDLIIKVVKKPGVAESCEIVYVKHISGGVSTVGFKAFEQGRKSFQGTYRHVIWLDEEPSDAGIYTECLTRTATTRENKEGGIIYCTFTPLYGISDVVLSFLPGGKFPDNGINPENPNKFVVNVTWDDVPHLTASAKAELLQSYSPHERAARSKGIPSLGAGAIYPYLEEDVAVEPFEIPYWWPKAYGLDVGWNRTAAVWAAQDPSTNQIYLYSEHYQGELHPSVHASSIKARGDWIPGVIDPKASNRSQADGVKLMDLYLNEGLDLMPADNSVESGIYTVGQKLASGQLKVFSTLRNWWMEYRLYRRDERGQIIKKDDHLMDATRYLIVSGMDFAQVAPDPDAKPHLYKNSTRRDTITGY